METINSTYSASGSVKGAGVQSKNKDFKRVLGLWSLIAVAVGVVIGQGPLISILQTVGIAGYGAYIAIGAAFILSLCYVATFAELSLMMPKAGSISTYTEVAIGHFPAIVAVFSGYVVVAMFGLSAEMFLVDAILGELFPGTFSPLVIAFIILGFFTLLNLMGIDIFAKAQNILAVAMIVFLLIVGSSGSFGLGQPQPVGINLFADWHFEGLGIFSLVALAIWGFVGAEFVCPLVEESRQPERDLPRAMFLGLFLILGVYMLLMLAALYYMPSEAIGSSELPHVDLITAIFGESGLIFIAVVAITGTCSTVNSVLAAVPRMLYGMAKNGQVFPMFKRVNTKGEPWVAVVFMALIVAVPLFMMGSDPDTIITLLIAASTCWFLTYIIAHIDLLVLRKRYPSASRPYKSPFYPIPQVVGILGMAYAAMNNSPSPEMTQQVYTIAGVVLLMVCVIGALWVKFVMKRGLFEPDSLSNVLER
ncbi:MAG: APC family permease [Halopseudomonas sp.]